MEFNKSNIKKILLIITFAAFVFWLASNYTVALSLIKVIISVISPFIIGLCVAFIINVLLRQLEKLWVKIPSKKNKALLEKLKRPVCLVGSILIIIGSIFILMFMIIPEISKTITMIIDTMPQYFNKLEEWWLDIRKLMSEYAIVLPEMDIDFGGIIDKVSSTISQIGPAFVDRTFAFTGSIFNGVFNFVLGLVFSMYVLAQKEKLSASVKKVLNALFDKNKVDSILEVCSLTNITFRNFVSGQLTEAGIIALLCFIGMCIFGFPYPLAISALVGFTALIPVFGAFIGTGVGAFLILMVSPIKALWFIVFIIVLQQLEGNLIYPRVVGKSVGLPGIWVLTAVTIGSGLFGLLGMLVAVPTFSVLYALFKRYVDKKSRK